MKALVGSWDNRPYKLVAEITALRAKVAELEEELARTKEENRTLRASLEETTDREVVLSR